jgi:PAS domain S-box-containing protein
MPDINFEVYINEEKDNLFSSFFYRSPVMQIITEASTGKIIDANDRFCRFYDYSREELIGKTMIEMNIMVNAQDREVIAKKVLKEKSIHGIEILERTKQGEYKWISTSINLLNLSGKDCFLGIGIDITEKKTFEAEMKKLNTELEERVRERTLEIRNFTEYLNKTQEDERARISREIHDELGQQLIGMKMGLSSLKKSVMNNVEAEKKLNNMISDVDESINSMKKIITQLRPGILDKLGLMPSLQWLAKEFQTKTGISCSFQLMSIEHNYDPDIAICFFRVCQEALNNIIKHANATKVSITVGQPDDNLIFKISDNGTGIAEERLNNPFSMGLIGMRERVNAINGILEITSEKNKGTTILLKKRIAN